MLREMQFPLSVTISLLWDTNGKTILQNKQRAKSLNFIGSVMPWGISVILPIVYPCRLVKKKTTWGTEQVS